MRSRPTIHYHKATILKIVQQNVQMHQQDKIGKVRKLANIYTSLIYYKSNFKAKGEIRNIQRMVFGLVSSHLEKHKA